MLICVSDRSLCRASCGLSADESYLRRLSLISDNKPYGIIIREKDLSGDMYEQLLRQAVSSCGGADIIIANKFITAALNAGVKRIQLSYSDFMENPGELKYFSAAGVSVHSYEEAQNAQENGASYLVYGHIFMTDCKKGLPPRGIESLRKICTHVRIPVFAIGGIKENNAQSVCDAGAAGVCVMSSLMGCKEDEISEKVYFYNNLHTT